MQPNAKNPEKTLMEACGMLAGKYPLLSVKDILDALQGDCGPQVQAGVQSRVGYRFQKLASIKKEG